jgi:hypothetical protein
VFGRLSVRRRENRPGLDRANRTRVGVTRELQGWAYLSGSA